MTLNIIGSVTFASRARLAGEVESRALLIIRFALKNCNIIIVVGYYTYLISRVRLNARVFEISQIKNNTNNYATPLHETGNREFWFGRVCRLLDSVKP